VRQFTNGLRHTINIPQSNQGYGWILPSGGRDASRSGHEPTLRSHQRNLWFKNCLRMRLEEIWMNRLTAENDLHEIATVDKTRTMEYFITLSFLFIVGQSG
jgi:hypothetical protein